MKSIIPNDIAAPFGRYSHGVQAGQLIVTSGQLGLDRAGHVPDDVTAQARICFENIRSILRDAGAGPEHILRLNAYVTDRAFFPGYMAVRDDFLAHLDVLPASTLMIVSGFTRPEFLVEVEAMALLPDD